MNEWKGIAIIAIWLGVGISCLKSKDGAVIAFWAFLATIIVVSS